jgi:hypothetical protein
VQRRLGSGSGGWYREGQFCRFGCACTPAFGRAEAPSARLFMARLKPCPSELGLRNDWWRRSHLSKARCGASGARSVEGECGAAGVRGGPAHAMKPHEWRTQVLFVLFEVEG